MLPLIIKVDYSKPNPHIARNFTMEKNKSVFLREFE